MTPLKSSNLKAASYEPHTCTLTVEFKSGGTHRYHDVPPETHHGLMNADSPGSYFHKHIKPHHQSSKVD